MESEYQRIMHGNNFKQLLGYFCILYFTCQMLCSQTTHAADWAFNPSVTVSEQHDSNIRLLPNDSQSKESDFITSFTPALSLARDTELTSFKIDSSTSVLKYTDNPRFDTIDTAFKGSLAIKWSPRFSTEANIAFVHDTTLEDQLEQAGIRTIKAERYRYEFGAGAKYALTEKISLLVSGSGGQSLYPSGEVEDQVTSRIRLVPAWALSERDTIGLESSFTYREFEKGLRIYNISEIIFLQRLLSETLSFSFGLGYQFQTTESALRTALMTSLDGLVLTGRPETKTDGTPIAVTEVKKDWSERFSTTVTAGRQQYTDVDGQSFESNFVGGIATYLVSERVTFKFSARYYSNTEIDQGGRKIDYFVLAPLMERKITANLGISLRAAYERELCDNHGNDTRADRYRTWIELTYRWPRVFASR